MMLRDPDRGGHRPAVEVENGLFWLDGAVERARKDGLWPRYAPPGLDGLFRGPEEPERLLAGLLELCDEGGDRVEGETGPGLPLTGGDIFCVGRNYVAHARELGNEVPGEPIIFMKPRGSLAAGGDDLVLPHGVEELNYEGEIALVLGRPVGGGESVADRREALFGVTLLNDITDRALQSRLKEKGKPWLAAKGGKGFAPLGPAVLPLESPDQLTGMELVTRVNGEQRQRGGPSLWIFDYDRLLEHLGSRYGLAPGDVVATGTPAGVGALRAGDTVEVSCEGIGSLRTRVVAEGDR
jgi:2-keto-4-pentenoate hydratase/2-oxohepta-3-ene-1,7-dioic acid hydratase in catechol pathway